jgi:hypothetical protein
MKTFKQLLAIHQAELSNHVLFELIDSAKSSEPLARMARALSWWPMVFQDMLRINFERVAGSELARAAKCHRDEDAGHEKWFLEDLRAFDVDVPGLEELFSPSFQPIRDACYALLAEVHAASTAAQRVALLLTLESTGHIFFEKVADATQRVCPELPLRYFAHFHLGVEKNHNLFADATHEEIEQLDLSAAERAGCNEMLTRVYQAFGGMFSYLEECVRENTRTVSHVRHLAAATSGAPSERFAQGS